MMANLTTFKLYILHAIDSNLNDTSLITITQFWSGSTILNFNVTVPNNTNFLNAGFNIYKKLRSKDFPFPLLS